MTKSVVAAVGVAAAVVWAAGAMAQEEAAKPAAPAEAGMRGGMMFAKMDANGDGKVSLEEYQAAMAEMAKTRFEAIDTNKDGALTEEEMRAGRERRGPGMGRPEGGRRGERGQASGAQEGEKGENKAE